MCLETMFLWDTAAGVFNVSVSGLSHMRSPGSCCFNGAHLLANLSSRRCCGTTFISPLVGFSWESGYASLLWKSNMASPSWPIGEGQGHRLVPRKQHTSYLLSLLHTVEGWGGRGDGGIAIRIANIYLFDSQIGNSRDDVSNDVPVSLTPDRIASYLESWVMRTNLCGTSHWRRSECLRVSKRKGLSAVEMRCPLESYINK